MKIVINRRHGGFGLSREAVRKYFENSGCKLVVTTIQDGKYNQYYEVLFDGTLERWVEWEVRRSDPALVEAVEELGSERASDVGSALKVVEIPDDVKWQIKEYDGMEYIAEVHRTWS